MSKQDKLDRIESFVYGALSALIVIAAFKLSGYLMAHVAFVWLP